MGVREQVTVESEDCKTHEGITPRRKSRSRRKKRRNKHKKKKEKKKRRKFILWLDLYLLTN
jgi:hypothetical protein